MVELYEKSKEETQYSLSLVLAGLGYSYRQLGLIWSSNNCFISSAAISLKSWYKSGKISIRSLHRILMIIENELLIGRIPNILSSSEMYMILSRQFNLQDETEELTDIGWIEGCLGTRLLNSNVDITSQQNILPDILESVGLWMSRKCLLFILGHEEILLKESTEDGFLKDENIQEFFNRWANQPFKNQMLFETNYGDKKEIQLQTKILGCELVVHLQNTNELIIFAEMILAFIEGFISTSLRGVMPTTERITINLLNHSDSKALSFSKEEDISKYNLYVNLDLLDKMKSENYSDVIFEFTIYLFVNHFYNEQPFEYVKGLFEKEETHERLSLVLNHITLTRNLFGDELKFTLNDWIKTSKYKEYDNIRTKPLIFNEGKDASEPNKSNAISFENETRHDKRKIISVINLELWNKAGWIGFGFIHHPYYGFGLFIAFKNGDVGRKIFSEWTSRFGKEDKQDQIKITLIRGISKSHPEWYRVVISSNENIWQLDQDVQFISTSRIHEMTPKTPENLLTLINIYETKKLYTLYPAKMNSDGSGIEPFLNEGIQKKELYIKFAWEIDENDMEAVAINEDDDPFIPSGVKNPPIIKTIERIKKYKKQKQHK